MQADPAQIAYFDVRGQYLSTETASRMLKVYREGLMPQALATYQPGLASHQTGTMDFESLFLRAPLQKPECLQPARDQVLSCDVLRINV
jgi:hypothetical protein